LELEGKNAIPSLQKDRVPVLVEPHWCLLLHRWRGRRRHWVWWRKEHVKVNFSILRPRRGVHVVVSDYRFEEMEA
jgi:hypothetical protein